MSLPSPLSVGDIILLGRIAYGIAKALSTGAKSAPAELFEVQTLLFSLKEAFDLLARTLLRNSRNDDGDELERQPELSRILNNCRDVFSHLESFVDNYSVLDPAARGPGDVSVRDTVQREPHRDAGHGDADNGNASQGDSSQQYAPEETAKQQNRTRKFQEDVKRSWKRVVWTKEGGDISKLKQALIAHTNALQLIVAVYNGDQQANIKGKVNKVHEKLDDMHEWLLVNLKTPACTTSATSARTPAACDEVAQSETSARSTSPNPLFSVLRQAKPGDPAGDARVICPRATFSSEMLSSGDGSNLPAIGSGSLFRCLCARSQNDGVRGLDHSVGLNNHSDRLDFTLLPISLLVQTLEQSHPNTWQIYLSAAGSSSPVSVLLSSNSPSCISAIEEVTHKLGALQIASHPQNDLDQSTALVQLSSDGLSILSSRAFVEHLTPRLLSIRLVVHGVGLLVPPIQGLQLHQYASAAPPQAWCEDSHPESKGIGFSNEQGFQIIIVCKLTTFGALAGSQTERYVLNGKLGSAPLKRIRAVAAWLTRDAENDSRRGQSVQCDKVEFEFRDSAAAEDFRAKLSVTKRALRLQYLQQCRKGEHIIYQRKIGDIIIGHLVLQGARLKVVRHHSTSRHRLILLSRNHAASACIELPDDFLATLAGSIQKRAQRYLTHLVDIREDGVNIVENSMELDLLSPLNHEIKAAIRLN